MKGLTKADVKVLCRAFGFAAKWHSDFGEWCVTAPGSETYFTNDNDDAVYTMLAQYRWYRQHGNLGGISTHLKGVQP